MHINLLIPSIPMRYTKLGFNLWLGLVLRITH
jgi:hypothetical protein